MTAFLCKGQDDSWFVRVSGALCQSAVSVAENTQGMVRTCVRIYDICFNLMYVVYYIYILYICICLSVSDS